MIAKRAEKIASLLKMLEENDIVVEVPAGTAAAAGGGGNSVEAKDNEG